MTLPLVNVRAKIADQEGKPLKGARIVMRLACVERYCGLVAPSRAEAVTDVNGEAVLRVWPNELGSEGSEYSVTVSFTDQGSCGCGRGSTSFQTQRFNVVVPNSDCNLHDIAEFPPYDRKCAGELVNCEMAQYAADAAASASLANLAVDGIQADKIETRSNAARAEAAQKGAEAARKSADEKLAEFITLKDEADNSIAHFKTSVCVLTDQAAQEGISKTNASIARAKDSALLSIETRAGDILKEIGNQGLAAQTTAVETVLAVKSGGIQAIQEEGGKILRQLREEGELFGEDFLALTERAEQAARRAGCSAAAADKAAQRACECADRAEKAEANISKVVLEAAAGIVSGEIIEEAAKKAKEGVLVMARTVWGPLAEQIIRLADRHTRDTAHAIRVRIEMAKYRQKMNEINLRLQDVEVRI